MHVSLEFFLVLLALLVVHRAVVFKTLLGAATVPGMSPARTLLVGLMSDAWVAVVCGVLLGSLTGVVAWGVGLQRVSRMVLCWVAGGVGVLAAAHTTYVEFFKFPIIPFHLHYLVDEAFLASNALSLLGAREILMIMVPLGVAYGLLVSGLVQSWSARQAAFAVVGLVVMGLYVHNRNIHCREQWFVPESLQVSPLERLYMHYTSDRHPVGVSPTELAQLQELLAKPDSTGAKTPWERLLAVLTDPPGSSLSPEVNIPPVVGALKNAFQTRVHAGRKPIVMVTLLESMRPAEAGYFGAKTDALPSITPAIDALVTKGIVFRQAYATGSVTRGGQEAVLCGFLGSRDTSLMRGAAVTSWDCLPRLVSGAATTFWYHGGQGLFDQQEAFWLSQGVQDTMSLKDFPEDAPRTSWGVGDHGFFQAVVPRLERLRRESKDDYLLGMALSLTNHIPWDLPLDLPEDLRSEHQGGHPSYLTTRYTDFAVGAFVQSLKQAGLWEDLLLMVVSDHGNGLPPYHDLYKGAPTAAARLDSHVQFFLIGGLTEEALTHEGLRQLDVTHLVSQADAAVLMADVIGVHNKRFFGANPFAESRNPPLIAILEEQIFSPRLGESWSRARLNQGPLRDQPRDALKAQLYYRAFMEFVGMPTPRM